MSFELRAILITACAITLIFIISKIKKSKMRIDDSIFWIFTSIFFIVVSIFPSFVIRLAPLLGFQSAANLVFFTVTGVMFIKLFMVSIYVSVLTEKNNRLVQHIALLEKRIETIILKTAP